MRRNLVLLTIGGLLASIVHAGPESSRVQAQADAALTGRVSSTQEGPMEGVVVSARREGSTISVSVVTDDKGRYSFPAAKLEPGRHALKIRAVGYELDGTKEVEVKAGATATADLTLSPAKNLAAQLTNAEWLASMPGSDQQKKYLLSCNGCHSYQPIVNSTHDAEKFLKVLERMAGYYPGSTPLQPQRLVGKARRNLGGGAGSAMGGEGGMGADPRATAAADWLATVNLSKGPARDYALKTLPRPTGRATRDDRHGIRSAAQDHRAARRDPRRRRHGLVLGLRRAVSRQDGPEDRQGHRISDSADQGRLPRRHARPRSRP